MRPQRLVFALWLPLWPLLFASLLCPLRLGMIRLAVALCLFFLWAGALWLGHARKPIRVFCLVLPLLPLCLFLPGRTADPVTLQRAYTASLRRYENTPYVWGGGNAHGIDCSGLVARGLMDADLTVGFRTVNPRLLRQGLSLWWHPCTAEALGNGYGGRTRFLLATARLNSLDYGLVQPGDLAVTSGGGHALAYLGDRTWIEADPSLLRGDKVITVQTPSRIAWFGEGMRLIRWRQLEGD